MEKATHQDFKQIFSGPVGERVLEELKRFCGAELRTADINNVYATYMAEGRREVWLVIQQALNFVEPEPLNKEDYEYE